MNFLKVKRREKIYYQISYKLDTQVYDRRFLLQKKATVMLLGLIPLWSTKVIIIDAPQKDLYDFFAGN